MTLYRENIEWCDIWIRNADRCGSAKPRVLFIGDSVTRAYYQAAESDLMQVVEPARLCTSRSLLDPVFAQEVTLVLNQFHADLIHVNNGLHGWDHDEHEYRAGLISLLGLLRRSAPRSRLVWAQTTPLYRSGHLDQHDERQLRVHERNRIASELMSQEGIPVHDLHAAVVGRSELFSSDGVHFNEVGNGVLSGLVQQVVRREISDRTK